MKVIKIVFFSLLALSLILSAGIFIFFQTFDAEQYLPQITGKASLALGRTVSVGYAGLGLSMRGLSLDLSPVTIADDPAFTSQPFVKVDRVRIFPDLTSLVLDRKIRISGILLESPQIHFIRSALGDINTRTIGRPVPPAVDDTAPVSSEANNAVPAEVAVKERPVFPAIGNGSIKITDGSISFIDQSQDDPLDIWMTNINARMDHFGTNGDIIITGGTIRNFNIIKTVLSRALGFYGSMGGFLDNLGANDTVVERAEAEFSLHDRVLNIDSFLLKTNVFEFSAKGSVDQGLNLGLQTVFHLSGDISASLVNKLGGLKVLCDDSNRITIDASLQGVIPRLKYKPNKDFRKKSRKALMEEGGNILGVLLGG